MVRPKLISFAFIFVVLSVIFASFISAAAIQDQLHLNIQTVDGSGNVVTGTFDFAFNISTSSDCGTVIYEQRNQKGGQFPEFCAKCKILHDL